MASKKETAEQKLLKMIEGSTEAAGASSAAQDVNQKRKFLVAVSLINKVLVVGIILAAIILGKEVIMGIGSSREKAAF